MRQKQSFTLSKLAELTNCQLVGNPHHVIVDIADLREATSQDASFYSNIRYQNALNQTQAGVIFIDKQTPLDKEKNYLISEQPTRAFQHLIDILYPTRKHPSGFTGIHPTAIIHETAQLAEGITVGPYAIIDEYVTIGKETFIGASCYIGPNVKIGESCLIYPQVAIREDCVVGDRVILQPGVVIGSCGFGYTTDQKGCHTKLNQVGNVILEDDVEIGANTTIERSRFKSTRVGKGSKINNLVQLGHGVEIGAHNLIIAQTGIAGSTTTGRHVVLAGQVAVAGHLHLADGVMVAGKSGVSKSLSKGKYSGIPVMPIDEHNRNQVLLRKQTEHVAQLKGLKKRVEEMEKALSVMQKN